MSQTTDASPTADFTSHEPMRLNPQIATPDAAVPSDVLRQQAGMILSAMEAAATGRTKPPSQYERRLGPDRVPLRQEITLDLYADANHTGERTLFLRDVEPRAAGFISPTRVPLGYGGTLTMRGFDGEEIRLGVTIIRCRSCFGGWFEGAAYFHKLQRQFGPVVEERA
jgi:hypothetical protein